MEEGLRDATFVEEKQSNELLVQQSAVYFKLFFYFQSCEVICIGCSPLYSGFVFI